MGCAKGYLDCSSPAMVSLGSMEEQLAIHHCCRRTPCVDGGGHCTVGFELRWSDIKREIQKATTKLIHGSTPRLIMCSKRFELSARLIGRSKLKVATKCSK